MGCRSGKTDTDGFVCPTLEFPICYSSKIVGSAGTPSATTDKVFLLSMTEVYGDLQSDGTQYEYYKSKGVSTPNYSGASSSHNHWTRSVNPSNSTSFRLVYSGGDWDYYHAANTIYVFPAFSF